MMKDQKPVMQNTFVRRLIPVAAAAGMSLTFAACGPTEPTEDNNMMAENNTSAMNNMTAGNNQTAGNNMTSGNNQTSGNMTTPTNNQTSGNQTTPPNNQTTPPNNQTSPPNNMTTPPNNQTTPPNNMTTPTNNTSPGLNGMLDQTEAEAFCQSYSDCDPTSFMDSYASIEECGMAIIDEANEIVSDASMDCQATVAALAESYFTALTCMDGSLGLTEAQEMMIFTDEAVACLESYNPGTVTVDDTKVMTFCQDLFTCEMMNAYYTDVAECISAQTMNANSYLAYLEGEYSVECAGAFKSYVEGYLGSFTCEEGSFTQGMVDPALEMALETECQ